MRLLFIITVGIAAIVGLLATLNLLLNNNIVPPTWPFFLFSVVLLLGILAFHLKSIIPLIVIIVSGIIVVSLTVAILDFLFPNPNRDQIMNLDIFYPALVPSIVVMALEVKYFSRKVTKKKSSDIKK